MRSVDIASGYRATLCRDAGLGRLYDAVRGRMPPLPTGFDRSVSSLLVTRAP